MISSMVVFSLTISRFPLVVFERLRRRNEWKLKSIETSTQFNTLLKAPNWIMYNLREKWNNSIWSISKKAHLKHGCSIKTIIPLVHRLMVFSWRLYFISTIANTHTIHINKCICLIHVTFQFNENNNYVVFSVILCMGISLER